MDPTLAKIDAIRERTGASYQEAYDALTAADGDVVEALIYLEAQMEGQSWQENLESQGAQVWERLRHLVRQGNTNRLVVRRDGSTVLALPVTLGALSALLLPGYTALGLATAVVTRCSIGVEKPEPTGGSSSSFAGTE